MAEENKPTSEELQAQIEKLQADLAKANESNEKLKAASSKAASEAADFKRQLAERMTEKEKAEAERLEAEKKAKEEQEKKEKEAEERIANYEKQLADMTKEAHKNAFVAMGYSPEDALAKAEALANNDFEKLQALEKARLEAAIKDAKADAAGQMSRPPAGGSSGKAKPMTYAEATEWLKAHPGESLDK